MKHWVIGPLLTTVFRPWVKGLENIPRSGPVIVVSNHLSLVDSLFLPMMVDRQMAFLAKSDYFTGKGLKGWLIRFFMTSSGQLPIDRSGGKASEASLNAGLAVLAEGKVLAIYPEGTRSPDGRLYRGRTGVARMVLEAGVPVIPTVMIDTDKVMPLGSSSPKFIGWGWLSVLHLISAVFRGWRGTVSCCAPSRMKSSTRCTRWDPRSMTTCMPRLFATPAPKHSARLAAGPQP